MENIKTVNLYGESDGISILINQHGDIVISAESEAIKEAAHFGDTLTRVIGHRLYPCSLDDAQSYIRAAYLRG